LHVTNYYTPGVKGGGVPVAAKSRAAANLKPQSNEIKTLRSLGFATAANFSISTAHSRGFGGAVRVYNMSFKLEG